MDEELDVSLMFTLGSGMEGGAAHEGSNHRAGRLASVRRRERHSRCDTLWR